MRDKKKSNQSEASPHPECHGQKEVSCKKHEFLYKLTSCVTLLTVWGCSIEKNSNKNIAKDYKSPVIFTFNLIYVNLMNQVLNIITQIHFHSLSSTSLPDTLFCFSQPELNDKTLKER